MKTVKTLCPTHLFHYSGVDCPFCEKERIHKLSKKYVKEIKVSSLVSKNKNDEVTEDDLERLKNKFNCK